MQTSGKIPSLNDISSKFQADRPSFIGNILQNTEQLKVKHREMNDIHSPIAIPICFH